MRCMTFAEPGSLELQCRPGLGGYSLASCTCEGCDITPPETCDAIRNATTTAGTLISLKNWSTESMVVVPQSNVKSPNSNADLKGRLQFALCAVC
jgi:hypothetical protein